MLPIDIVKTTVADIAELEAGRFFFHQTDGVFGLAVSLAQNGRFLAWMNLSGPSSFLLEHMNTGYRKRTLALGVEPKRTRLRIADGVAPVVYSKHVPGHLIFDAENGPSIATRWADGDEDADRRIVALRSWEAVPLGDARGGVVSDWALSFVDESNHWIDLVAGGEASRR